MPSRTMRCLILAGVVSFAAVAQPPPARVIFVEPVGKLNASGPEIRESMPLYRPAAEPAKYAAWMKNEAAERAPRLYRQAWEIVHPGGESPDYYVALVPGGNHGAVGFRLRTDGGVREFPRHPYIVLGPEEWLFDTTLLHETGHVVMSMLAGGRRLEGDPIASIPHSTAALSDRVTAFTEGYAIHLETLAAHLARSPELRRQYHRESIRFGEGPWKASEYFRHSADLTSYSQTVARYLEVRDNNFAFEAAFQGPDYLRVQLEKTRDFASLRDANQLLQSEGFYASFFFLLLMRGADLPSEATIAARQDHILRAMQALFASAGAERSTPWLVRFVQQYMQSFPDEQGAIADVLNDLSHGVFVDPAARQLWREHYLAALHIDRAKLNIQPLEQARKRWREQILADPRVLLSRLGPQIRCTVAARKVRIEVFEEDAPLRFDINTAPPGILRMIPGISAEEVDRWIGERDRRPFAGPDDLRARAALGPATWGALKF